MLSQYSLLSKEDLETWMNVWVVFDAFASVWAAAPTDRVLVGDRSSGAAERSEPSGRLTGVQGGAGG